MKVVYPVIISKGEKYLIASIPDCEIDTQGETLAEAIEMARDAISIWCVTEQDAGRKLPQPSEVHNVSVNSDDIITLVDADISAYRRMLDLKVVRKNVTVPSWLNYRAEKSNINFSQTLQRALKEELQITE
ncbi:MAG: type II toxin-antitoxin system HicB family antitoxin [Defluviitaleaceae bacterium]|nr:type II toxin-antitoxin system HicB family antitoxin [Defluviitaleaceae bacterium]